MGTMDVVHEVPPDLRHLVRLVARSIFSPELAMVVDALIKHQCVREEALADHLLFERKQLRQIIAQMRQNRLVQTRLRMETGPDGKSQRHNYYYINYKSFVNIVRYKLDLLRRKIETEERESTSRASFKCQGCDKCYTDLEADQLIDFATGEFRCPHCGSSVEEAESAASSEMPQQLLVRFNERMEIIFKLLRNVEDIKLAPGLLEPEPKELEVRVPGQPRGQGAGGKSGGGNPGDWSGDATRYAAATVTVGEAISTAMRETKEIPMWLQKSTVVPGDEGGVDFLQGKSANPFQPSNVHQVKTMSAQDIMDALLAHEKQPKVDGAPGGGNESEDEDSDGWEEVPVELPMVWVDGGQVALHDITQELVDKMTPDERRSYTAVAQQFYAAFYE
ncbi:general transcription factor IIE subunit 1-like isoform X2 [Varroa destructor]|uniref:HTH TFE/IIEalpha-type domain-containing protein n=1 Tax=Varroa destructor TaxID=109461 RepID=A0A7M7KT81_VARDE|nr:general transcription factor IIE subunit 1-like isoform X2 [Varroa destructor]